VEFIKTNICEDDAHMWEYFWIAEYGRRDLGLGPLTNGTDGGEGSRGVIMPPDSDETRYAKGSAYRGKKREKSFVDGLKGNQYAKGNKLSDDTRSKMSESHLGKPRTDEFKAMMAGNQYAKGNKLSDETRAKMSAAHRNKPTVECPHCGKAGKECAAMYRYHFNNCKFKDKR